MNERTTAQLAERLSRQRARMLPVLAIIYLSQQASYFSQSPAMRTVDHFKIGAWVVLSLLLLFALVTKGFWFHSREVRDLVDDELTRANRNEATRVGFIATVLTGIAVYFVAEFEPMSANEAIHIVLTIGLGAALIRFGFLERRALRDA